MTRRKRAWDFIDVQTLSHTHIVATLPVLEGRPQGESAVKHELGVNQDQPALDGVHEIKHKAAARYKGCRVAQTQLLRNGERQGGQGAAKGSCTHTFKRSTRHFSCVELGFLLLFLLKPRAPGELEGAKHLCTPTP